MNIEKLIDEIVGNETNQILDRIVDYVEITRKQLRGKDVSFAEVLENIRLLELEIGEDYDY